MFAEQLTFVMEERRLSTSDVARMTGISKASISNYKNGRQIPSVQQVVRLEKALDFHFSHADLNEPAQPPNVKRLTVREAAKIMSLSEDTLRTGIKQGVFPWAYAIQTGEKRWTYVINAEKLRRTEFE